MRKVFMSQEKSFQFFLPNFPNSQNFVFGTLMPQFYFWDFFKLLKNTVQKYFVEFQLYAKD